MSDDKIYLSREEQLFLMDMFETKTPMEAVETFATFLAKEGADPAKLEEYVKKILVNWKKKVKK